MFSSKLLVMSFVVMLVLAATLTDAMATKRGLCGAALDARVSQVCGQKRRSLEDVDLDEDFAKAMVRSVHGKRSLNEECCHEGCNTEEISEVC